MKRLFGQLYEHQDESAPLPEPDGTPLRLLQNAQGMLFLNRIATEEELAALSATLFPNRDLHWTDVPAGEETP